MAPHAHTHMQFQTLENDWTSLQRIFFFFLSNWKQQPIEKEDSDFAQINQSLNHVVYCPVLDWSLAPRPGRDTAHLFDLNRVFFCLSVNAAVHPRQRAAGEAGRPCDVFITTASRYYSLCRCLSITLSFLRFELINHENKQPSFFLLLFFQVSEASLPVVGSC